MNDPAGEEANRSRHIRSFSGRRGHITGGQRQAYEAGLPRFGIPYGRQPLNLEQAFGRSAPTVLEIGFGMGDATVAIAAARPECDFVGVEVHEAGVGALLRKIGEHSLHNVRIVRHDALEVLQQMLAPGSLAAVHLFFPDPWPKKRHHKRRLVQHAPVSLLASRLEPGGVLHCATDWEPYAEQMLQVLSAEPLLRNTADGWAARPDYRPQTRFEARGLRLGHGVRDLIFERVAPES